MLRTKKSRGELQKSLSLADGISLDFKECAKCAEPHASDFHRSPLLLIHEYPFRELQRLVAHGLQGGRTFPLASKMIIERQITLAGSRCMSTQPLFDDLRKLRRDRGFQWRLKCNCFHFFLHSPDRICTECTSMIHAQCRIKDGFQKGSNTLSSQMFRIHLIVSCIVCRPRTYEVIVFFEQPENESGRPRCSGFLDKPSFGFGMVPFHRFSGVVLHCAWWSFSFHRERAV